MKEALGAKPQPQEEFPQPEDNPREGHKAQTKLLFPPWVPSAPPSLLGPAHRAWPAP